MNFPGMKDLPWRSYMRDTWLEDRIAMTKKYGLAAIAGPALIALGLDLQRKLRNASTNIHRYLDAHSIFHARNCFHGLAAPISR